MKRIDEFREVDEHTVAHVKEWHLDKWYEKVVYVLGVIYTILIAFGFIVGFVNGYIGK